MTSCALEAAEVKEWRSRDSRHDHAIEGYYDAPLPREHVRRPPAELIYIEFKKSSNREALKREFSKLAGRWESETAHISSTHDLVIHQCYQCILTLGKDVVPLILERMKRRPNYWFWALRIMTGENPVSSDIAGNLEAMTDRWLDWGRQKGLIE
jgi:hypothetical protein